MYGGEQGRDAVMNFLGQTGTDALKGADILRTAPAKYASNIEYAANPMAESMKSVAQVMFADLGTRIYFTNHGSFDTHSGELPSHAKLWQEVSGAVGDFYGDMKEHGREDDAVIFIFTEFGRRIKDNGSGTDHGSGGWRSSSAIMSRAGCTVSTLSEGRGPAGRRPPLQQRLSQHILYHPGAVAGVVGSSHRKRPVRSDRLH